MNIQTVRSKSPFHLQPCVFGIQLVPLAIAAPHSAVNEVFFYLPPQHPWNFGVLKAEIAGLTAFTPPDCQIPGAVEEARLDWMARREHPRRCGSPRSQRRSRGRVNRV